jgi:flagellar motor switch protein FliG
MNSTFFPPDRERAQAFTERGCHQAKPISISTFEDIEKLDDDQIREIIARVGRDDLTVALKAASDPLKDRILGNMPPEDRQALTEYMEFLGPMLVTEVQLLQLQILHKFGGRSGDEKYC